MPDLKVIIYKDGSEPRSLSVDTKILYKSLYLLSFAFVLLATLIVYSVRLKLQSKQAVFTQSSKPDSSQESDSSSTSGSNEDQLKLLKDQVDSLKSRLKNQQDSIDKPKEIDKGNPALALFSPNIVDKTSTRMIDSKNYNFTPPSGKNPAVLSFELHNLDPDSGPQKGYILVLARAEYAIDAYPDVMNTKGNYLLEFEKGETFNISRFRMVNAQFNHLSNTDVKSFQILIFSRQGELLINRNYELPSGN